MTDTILVDGELYCRMPEDLEQRIHELAVEWGCTFEEVANAVWKVGNNPQLPGESDKAYHERLSSIQDEAPILHIEGPSTLH